MNIGHLTLFVRVASTHNISQAGTELGLSPAVASAYIAKLEASLGVRLVHRTTRKVALTEDGLAFLQHAEDVLASIEAAKASVGAGSQMPSGTLRVAASASFGRMHLLPAIPSFLACYPGLRIDLKLSDTIVDLVEGGFDIAIRNSALKDSSLIARKLSDDRRIVCASPQYLAEKGRPCTPDDLYKHNCITLMGLEKWVFNTGSIDQIVKVSGNFSADNGEAIRDACIHGLGITLNSTWCAYQAIQRGSLVQILPEYPIKSDAAIWAVYPSSRQLAPKVRAFIDYFSEYYGDSPYWDDVLTSL